MSVAIRAEALGKFYYIGEFAAAHRSMRSTIGRTITAPYRRLRRLTDERVRGRESIWALRNVSFEVDHGDIVGIIGRNGAGKSTLLKILSRITAPTEGRAVIYGDVGSLLEVGTGFNPELTGRENIYLNGAILGMPRSEIKKRFDEIVAFSGVERFIDTPVKRYSSGMGVRLAFSVAAHLEPEILLVDEVLAVGDAEFQKKCLGRMEQATAGGRTIIFVSHSMAAVLRICPRVILMDGGSIVADGPAQEVVHKYLDTGLGTSAARVWEGPDKAPGDEVVRLRSVRVLDEAGRANAEVDIRRPIDIEVEYWLLSTPPAVDPALWLGFWNEQGTLLFISTDTSKRALGEGARRPGVFRSVCRVPGNLLAEGQFFIGVTIDSVKARVRHVVERDLVAFHVVDRSQGDGARGDIVADWPGVIRPRLEWRAEKVTDEVPVSDLSSR